MCRCYICDASIEKPQVDGRDGKVLPCAACLTIIYETAGELEDESDEEPGIIPVIPFECGDLNEFI